MGQSPPHGTGGGTHILHVGKCGPPSPMEVPISPLFGTNVCHTHTGVICGKYALVSITLSHRSDEAMSIWTWQKLV